MPIVDYKALSTKEKNKLLSNDLISKANKSYIQDFLDSYDVSPARLRLFCVNITYLLQDSKDIKIEMLDRKIINQKFSKLREQKGISHYSTIVNVSNRFVTWLNDGAKPKGFTDIKNTNKKTQRRMNNRLFTKDLLSWDDGLLLAKQTDSPQFQAIIMTQLDGGFRPSEFIDLSFDDVRLDSQHLVVTIKTGKTGFREVILTKSAPYLQRWLNMHPTKNGKDPLWIMEKRSNKDRKDSVYKKYQYHAIKKRIHQYALSAGIKKPVDFYAFRHSSAHLKKTAGVSVDLGAKMMGHSVQNYTEVYGTTDTKEDIERLDKVYNKNKKRTKNEPIKCEICSTLNVSGADICEKCRNPLSITKALEIIQKKDVDKAQMKTLEEKSLAQDRQIKELIRIVNQLKDGYDEEE